MEYFAGSVNQWIELHLISSQEKWYKLLIPVWIVNQVLFYINCVGSQTGNTDIASFQLTNIVNINIYIIIMTSH